MLALALAWLSYRADVQAAIAYGQVIDVAFDLHRFNPYPALHIAVPVNLDDERALNAQPSGFLRQGAGPGFVYSHPPSKPG